MQPSAYTVTRSPHNHQTGNILCVPYLLVSHV
uniref:Uncharacterized protein n=1 Tax=Anguilla anguilla TaxID=7936 RepID=A0A0E9PET7_ANGAN